MIRRLMLTAVAVFSMLMLAAAPAQAVFCVFPGSASTTSAVTPQCSGGGGSEIPSCRKVCPNPRLCYYVC